MDFKKFWKRLFNQIEVGDIVLFSPPEKPTEAIRCRVVKQIADGFIIEGQEPLVYKGFEILSHRRHLKLE